MNERIWLLSVGAIAVAAIVLGIWVSIKDNEDCQARGGVVHCTTSSGYTVGKNGGPTTLTTCECYWPDGRIMIR
jgi:hypothetical protein